MKYKKLFLLIIGVTIFCFSSGFNVRAVDCSDTDENSDRFTLSGSCSFPGQYIDGVDANGANSTNSAILTIVSGVTLTIPSQQTLATGTIDMKGGGSIIITKGSQIKLKTPIYMTDADSDGTPASTSAIIVPNVADKRKYTITRPTVSDCKDSGTLAANVWSATTCSQDLDQDGYTSAAAAKTCTNHTTCTSVTYASTGSNDDVTSYSAGQLKTANGSDCNDTGTNSSNVYVSATCYTDADNDNYGTGTAKSCTNNATCGSATWASGGEGTTASSGNFSANANDCNDSSISIYPGTTCNGVCSLCAASGGTCGAAPAGKNGQATCQYCNGVSLDAVNMTAGSDTYGDCTASLTSCADVCNKAGPDGNCNGAGACNTGGNSGYVSNLKVCTGAATEIDATTSVYASIANSCNSASCSGTRYYRACNGSGATRSDNTGAASQTIYATAGQSLNTSCDSGANGNPGSTCQKCNGSGSLTVQASNEDLYNQCATGGSGTATVCQSNNCSGSNTYCGSLGAETTCRTVAGTCDVAETCAGISQLYSCPTDAFLAAGDQNQAACKQCDGTSANPVNVTNNTQDTLGTYKCNTTCQKCSSGSCVGQSGQDLFNHCADTDDGTVVMNSASGLTCAQKCATYNYQNGNCNAGACESHSGTCSDVGTDGANNYYRYWDDTCKSAAGATCSTKMSNQSSLVCNGYTVLWTQCTCN